MKKDLTSADAEKKGLVWCDTGGGCSAYCKQNSDGSFWMITALGGCGVPTKILERAVINFHRADGVQMASFNAPFGLILDGTIELSER
ncbi:MAG: hypothetical protein ABSA46_19880 [Thermodesulfovibrionales bacterium]